MLLPPFFEQSLDLQLQSAQTDHGAQRARIAEQPAQYSGSTLVLTNSLGDQATKHNPSNVFQTPVILTTIWSTAYHSRKLLARPAR